MGLHFLYSTDLVSTFAIKMLFIINTKDEIRWRNECMPYSCNHIQDKMNDVSREFKTDGIL